MTAFKIGNYIQIGEEEPVWQDDEPFGDTACKMARILAEENPEVTVTVFQLHRRMTVTHTPDG